MCLGCVYVCVCDKCIVCGVFVYVVCICVWGVLVCALVHAHTCVHVKQVHVKVR